MYDTDSQSSIDAHDHHAMKNTTRREARQRYETNTEIAVIYNIVPIFLVLG